MYKHRQMIFGKRLHVSQNITTKSICVSYQNYQGMGEDGVEVVMSYR